MCEYWKMMRLRGLDRDFKRDSLRNPVSLCTIIVIAAQHFTQNHVPKSCKLLIDCKKKNAQVSNFYGTKKNWYFLSTLHLSSGTSKWSNFLGLHSITLINGKVFYLTRQRSPWTIARVRVMFFCHDEILYTLHVFLIHHHCACVHLWGQSYRDQLAKKHISNELAVTIMQGKC